MALDRNAFLEAVSCAREEVEVAGVGKLMVRSLSQEEAGHVRKLSTSDDPVVRFSVAAYIVSRCVLSVDGQRMFTDQDEAKLSAMDSEALSAVAIAVRKVSKLPPEEVQAEGEGSAATT